MYIIKVTMCVDDAKAIQNVRIRRVIMDKAAKEIITITTIEKELKTIYCREIVVSSFLILLFILPFYFLTSINYVALLNIRALFFVVLGFFCMVMAALLYIFFNAVKNILYVALGRLTIKEDTMVGSEESNYLRRSGFYRPHRLYFTHFGRFDIPNRVHYKWSRLFSVNENELFRSSCKGDLFYIAVQKNKKILCVYNAKFFEFRE